MNGRRRYWQLSTANIGDSVLNCIEDAVTANNYGSVTVTVQDGYLIQIDIEEKIWLDGSEQQPQLKGAGARNPLLRSKILKALVGLKFGQVILTVKQGKLTQIDRNVRTRMNKIEGLYGDGI